MEDPLTLVERRGGRGATWCHRIKGLGAKGTCHIKGEQRRGSYSHDTRCCQALTDENTCHSASSCRMTGFLPSLLLAQSPSPTGWITGRGCSGNVCCIERKPQLVQSLDNSPDVGLMGGAWMELERHIPKSHLAEVAIPLSLTVCLPLHGLGEGKWRRKRGQEMAPGLQGLFRAPMMSDLDMRREAQHLLVSSLILLWQWES